MRRKSLADNNQEWQIGRCDQGGDFRCLPQVLCCNLAYLPYVRARRAFVAGNFTQIDRLNIMKWNVGGTTARVAIAGGYLYCERLKLSGFSTSQEIGQTKPCKVWFLSRKACVGWNKFSQSHHNPRKTHGGTALRLSHPTFRNSNYFPGKPPTKPGPFLRL